VEQQTPALSLSCFCYVYPCRAYIISLASVAMFDHEVLLEDIDPDDNIFNNYFASISADCQSSYYSAERFIDIMSGYETKLSIVNFNIRSFSSNVDNFLSFMRTFDFEFHIFCFTETWFSSDECTPSLAGFDAHHTVRCGRGGGVSLYCSQLIESQKLEKQSFVDDDIEVCTVRIVTKPNSIIIIAIYRPPNGKVDVFCDRLSALINESSFAGGDIVLIGDLNINLLLSEVGDSNVELFTTMMNSLSFLPHITKPTRFPTGCQAGTPSLLDHIWFNRLYPCISGIMISNISDHMPNFVIILNQDLGTPSTTKIMFRDHCESNMRIFLSKIGQCNNIIADNGNDLNLLMESFHDRINEIYCESFPLKIKFLSRKRLSSPWLRGDLLSKIKLKSKYFKLLKLDLITNEFYNRYRNMVTNSVRNAKKNYFRACFERSQNDCKQTWKIIKNLMNVNVTKSKIKSIVVNDRIVSGDGEIADLFNRHFTNVAHKINDSIPPPVGDPVENIVLQSDNSFFLFPVTKGELLGLISKIKNSRYGINTIPTFIFKKAAYLLIDTITLLVNKSFSLGVFPNCLKYAQVVPVYKDGPASCIDNYRPISVLPMFSKIIEKCMYIRLVAFLDKFNLLSESQFGFRSGSNTSKAILKFMKFVYCALDERCHVLGMFIDLRKAFDTVDHNTLLRKMNRYGVRGIANDWFKSYLSGRYQCVRVGNSKSDFAAITVGVPQGSVIGPLLFLLYINDLPNISREACFSLFADDTTVAIRNENYSDLINAANSLLDRLCVWTKNNRLSLNANKSSSLLITNRRSDIQTPTLVTIGDSPLWFADSVKFLGVHLDRKLNFSHHVRFVSSKLSKTVGIFYRIRDLVPESLLISLYYSLFYPYLIYCVLVWGNTYDEQINSIVVLQKRVVRLITSESYLAHTDPLFYRTRILKFEDIYKLFVGVDMFFRRGSNSVEYPSHDYLTRNRNNALPSFHRLTLSQSSVDYQGPIVWNSIPSRVKACTNVNSFKKEFKDFLVDRYNST